MDFFIRRFTAWVPGAPSCVRNSLAPFADADRHRLIAGPRSWPKAVRAVQQLQRALPPVKTPRSGAKSPIVILTVMPLGAAERELLAGRTRVAGPARPTNSSFATVHYSAAAWC
jgi:hypothetical protein